MIMLFAWLSQVLYTICFIPQIITNMRNRSASGVSDGLLFGYLNLLAGALFYVFLLDLPLAYKIFVPLQAAAVATLIGQRLWYDDPEEAKQSGALYVGNILLLLAFIPYASSHPIWVGHVGGWALVLFGFLSQAPQIWKVWQTQSVAGFDRRFVLVTFWGSFAELAGALLNHLPMQTILSALRGIVLCTIMLWQFAQYTPQQLTTPRGRGEQGPAHPRRAKH